MDSGDDLRKKVGGDALAILTMGKIQKIRTEKTGWLAEQFSKAEKYYQSLPLWKRELIKNNNE